MPLLLLGFTATPPLTSFTLHTDSNVPHPCGVEQPVSAWISLSLASNSIFGLNSLTPPCHPAYSPHEDLLGSLIKQRYTKTNSERPAILRLSNYRFTSSPRDNTKKRQDFERESIRRMLPQNPTSSFLPETTRDQPFFPHPAIHPHSCFHNYTKIQRERKRLHENKLQRRGIPF